MPSPKPKTFARIAAVSVFLVGLLVLLGWTFDITTFKSVLSGWPKVSPLTMLALLLSAFSLWCAAAETTNANAAPAIQRQWRKSQISAAAVVLIGLIRLGSYAFGWNFHFDSLAFHEVLAAGETPARMAHATALEFVFIGSALFLAGFARCFNLFQFFVLITGLIACLGMLRYLYGGEPLMPYSQMSAISGLCFLLLSGGTLCVRADRGLLALADTQTAGGVLVRRLLPMALIMPFLLGWLRLWGQKAGWFGMEAGLGLFALSNVVLFTALIWITAFLLQRAEAIRSQAERNSIRLGAIVEFSEDAIIGKDLNSVITSWNSGAQKMFGYQAQEMIGQSINLLIPPKRLSEEERILSRIKLGEQVQHFETVRLKKDGQLIDVSIAVSPIKDANGTISGASKVARDISARKQAEVALRESESRYRTLFDCAPDGIVIANQKSYYLDANPSLCRMLGYTRDELVGQHASKIVAQSEIQHIGSALRELNVKEDYKREWQFRRKDGSVFSAEVIATMMPDGNLMAMIRDITERKLAEQNLRLSHERMLLAAEATGVGIWEWNVLTNKIRWDALMFRLYGVAPTADGFVDYRIWSETVLPEDLSKQEEVLQDTLRRQGRSTREFRIRRKTDGALREIEAVETVRTNAAGQTEWVVGTNLDITDRRNSERALHEKEQQLHATDRRLAEIVHGMTEACFALDNDWRFTFVNERAETLLRCPREQMLGKIIWEVFPRAVGTPSETNYRRAMTERVPVAFEIFSAVADRWLDVRLFPTAEGMAAFLLDIHARKLGETALRETQERLSSALAAGLIGTWTWDIVHDNLVADEFTAHVFSVDAAAAAKGLPAAAYLKAVADEDQPTVSAKLAEAIKTCGTYDIEYRVRQFDGDYLWLQARGRVDGDEAGNAVHFHGAVMDITARKWTEAALRQSEERFRTMTNSMSQLAWIAQPDGFLIWYNQRWYEYTGTTPAQMEGSGWQTVHDPEVLPRVVEKWQRAIIAGEPFEMEFPLRGADGKFRRFLTRGQPFKNADGEVMQWFGTNTDVETLKQAEEKIQRLNVELEERVIVRTAQLEAANKELESFSYSVSHDLRAPLRAVNGFAGIVLEEHGPLLNEEGRRYLERIRNGGQRMGELIDDLLTFSRLSRQPLKLVPVDLAKLLQAILDESAHEREGRAIDLRLGEFPACEGDPALLKQVWVNLISNAVKYSRGRTPAIIEIDCQAKDGEKIFFVRDNGTGFDMRYVHKLFNVFQRLHRADEFEGTGVGLAIVQRIIHRHGGKVWAEAAEGRGATFYFTLKPEKNT